LPPAYTDYHTADPWSRCEFGKTLHSEGECQRTGDVQFDGSVLGTVFEMDKWLDNPDNRADQLRWRRLLRERDEVVEQLRFNRRLLEAHKEANQQR
jgi:hypothetical protein